MILLGLILILLPIGVGIVIWTDVASKLWFKILASIAMVICSGMIIGGGVTYNELEEADGAIEYVAERDTNYLDCINNSYDDDVFGDCVLENLKLLTETYE